MKKSTYTALLSGIALMMVGKSAFASSNPFMKPSVRPAVVAESAVEAPVCADLPIMPSSIDELAAIHPDIDPSSMGNFTIDQIKTFKLIGKINSKVILFDSTKSSYVYLKAKK